MVDYAGKFDSFSTHSAASGCATWKLVIVCVTILSEKEVLFPLSAEELMRKQKKKSFCQNTFYELLQVQQSYFSLTEGLGKFSCIATDDPGDKAY